jgi:hypothetical protein
MNRRSDSRHIIIGANAGRLCKEHNECCQQNCYFGFHKIIRKFLQPAILAGLTSGGEPLKTPSSRSLVVLMLIVTAVQVEKPEKERKQREPSDSDEIPAAFLFGST